VTGLEDLAGAQRFRSEDLDKKEAELKRLYRRRDAIAARDVLGTANPAAVTSSLARCQAAIGEYARDVYRDGTSHAPAGEVCEPGPG
jgi:hypothetical protein